MRPLLRVAIVATLAVGIYYLFLRPKEFVVAESFPTLASTDSDSAAGPQLATFGSGCFWCTEAVFQQRRGVQKVVSGYSGGKVANPTYEQICNGNTGHAEVIQVTYDPKAVSYAELLELFWRSHDPTTKDQQGNDYGSQYRSVVFYHDERQKNLAERYLRMIDDAHVFPRPLVTEISPLTVFYPAEAYHQNYFLSNPNQPYCRALIGPKLEKLKKVFADKLVAKPE